MLGASNLGILEASAFCCKPCGSDTMHNTSRVLLEAIPKNLPVATRGMAALAARWDQVQHS